MSYRKSAGSMLGMVALCALVLILVGAVGFWVLVPFSAQLGAQDAANAGALNVAKTALSQVVASVPSSSGFAGQLSSDSFSHTDFLGNRVMNVVEFNRALGYASTVALNVQDMKTDGPVSQAQTNLNNLLQVLELSPSSIGYELCQSLSTGTGRTNTSPRTPWAQTAFYQAASANSKGSLAFRTFKAAYFTTPSYLNGSNVLPPGPTTGLPPGAGAPGTSGTGFIPGNQTVAVGAGSITPVDVEPTQPPHLISLDMFNKARYAFPTPTAFSGSAFIPPNAFRIDATVTNSTAKTGTFTMTVSAAAVMGALAANSSFSGLYNTSTALPGDGIPGHWKHLIKQLEGQPAYALPTSTLLNNENFIPYSYFVLDTRGLHTNGPTGGARTLYDRFLRADPTGRVYQNFLQVCTKAAVEMSPDVENQDISEASLNALFRTRSLAENQVQFLYIKRRETGTGPLTSAVGIGDSLPWMSMPNCSSNINDNVNNRHRLDLLSDVLENLSHLERGKAATWNSVCLTGTRTNTVQLDGNWKVTGKIDQTVAYQRCSGAWGCLGAVKF